MSFIHQTPQGRLVHFNFVMFVNDAHMYIHPVYTYLNAYVFVRILGEHILVPLRCVCVPCGVFACMLTAPRVSVFSIRVHVHLCVLCVSSVKQRFAAVEVDIVKVSNTRSARLPSV
jgi:hypothetical protein